MTDYHRKKQLRKRWPDVHSNRPIYRAMPPQFVPVRARAVAPVPSPVPGTSAKCLRWRDAALSLVSCVFHAKWPPFHGPRWPGYIPPPLASVSACGAAPACRLGQGQGSCRLPRPVRLRVCLDMSCVIQVHADLVASATAYGALTKEETSRAQRHPALGVPRFARHLEDLP